FERCGGTLRLDRKNLVEVLQRASRDHKQLPIVRGSLVGALWVLGETDSLNLRDELQYFRDAAQLGDFLTGLFQQAREVIQRDNDLLKQIDSLIQAYDDDQFLEA